MKTPNKKTSMSILILFHILFTAKIVNCSLEGHLVDTEVVILNPSLANPIIITAGEKFEIVVRNANDYDTPNVRLISDFITYSIPVIQEEKSENEIVYEVQTSDKYFPFLYDLSLEFSTMTKISLNAVMIEIPPSKAENIRFLHITDLHVDGSDLRTQQVQKLIKEINLINPNFIILSGDLVEGLTSIDDQIITGEIQFPILIDLLKNIRVPAVIVNGNHDFQTNAYQNGSELWERYISPIDHIVQFDYKDYFFAGISTTDNDGLQSERIDQIISIYNHYQADLNFFVAHSDYEKNQFPQIYSQANITASFLGHDHTGSVNMVGSTIEIISDNAVPVYALNEPGHYRLCEIKDKILNSYEQEIESLKLDSKIWEDRESDSSTKIAGWINNSHESVNFSELHEEIVISGQWEVEFKENISDTQIFLNGTHSKILIHFQNVTENVLSYQLELKQKALQLTTCEESSKALSSSISSKTDNISTHISEGFLIANFILIISLIEIKRKYRGKK